MTERPGSPTFPAHLSAIDIRTEYERTEMCGGLVFQGEILIRDGNNDEKLSTSYVGHTASPYERVIYQLPG